MSFDRVAVRRVGKLYGRHRALWDVTLETAPGDRLGLLGPNGAGKTTLLWLLSTLSRPSSGTLQVGPYSGDQVVGARGRIALLTHDSMTYDDLTGLENLELVAELSGRPRADASAWLAHVELEDAAERPAKTYSRGMRQRLGLARCLMIEPELLLLDEPFTGLDRASGEALERRLRAHPAVQWIVTHELDRAARICNRFAFLRRGRLTHVIDGPADVETLRAAYATHVEGAAHG